MAKDIIARLKADTGQWDRGFGNAGRTLEKFQRQNLSLNGVMEAGVKALAGFAAGFAGLEGVMGTLKRAFELNEQAVDEWGRTCQSAKSLFDGFLNSLNSGDISGYLNNMGNIVNAARAAYDAMDELGTFNAFNQRNLKNARRGMTEAVADYRGGTGSAEAVKAAGQTLKNELKTRNGLEADEYAKQVALKAAEHGVKADDLMKALSGSWGEYKKLKSVQMTGTRYEFYSDGRGGSQSVAVPYAKNEQERLGSVLRMFSDKELDALQALGGKAEDTADEMANIDKQVNRITSSANKIKTTGGSGKTASVKGLNTKEMKGMNWGNDFMELVLPDFEAQVNNYIMGMDLAPLPIKVDWEAVNREFAAMNLAEVKTTAEGVSQALGAASSAMGEFAGESKGAAAAQKSFSIAAAITQLVAQFAAIPKGAEIWSWIAGTIAGTGTLVASVASLAKLNKGSYASGGVVPGSYNGGVDNTYVYASPGELILNRAQQNSIAGQLSGGTGGGTTTVHSEDIVIAVNNWGRRNGKGVLQFG